MTPREALELLAASGIRLYVRDGFLKARGPAGMYTDQFRALVAEHRHTFIHEWRCLQCGAICPVLYGIRPVVRCLKCARGNEE